MVLVYLRVAELITRNLSDPGEICKCLRLFNLLCAYLKWERQPRGSNAGAHDALKNCKAAGSRL